MPDLTGLKTPSKKPSTTTIQIMSFLLNALFDIAGCFY
jgi:hypothetical protein